MNRKKIILIHAVFWIVFVLISVLVTVAAHNHLHVTFSLFVKNVAEPGTLTGYSSTILFCYGSLWVFDKLLTLKKYYFAVLSIFILIIVNVLFLYTLEQLLMGPLLGIWQYPRQITLWEYFNERVSFSALSIFVCFLLKTVNYYYKNENLKREKMAFELEFLKSQVNPHFLFNTLNNLYGLSLTEPGRASAMILKLSEMMRYMLYDSLENKVPLSKELDCLQNFIDLQKIRFEGETYIDFSLDGYFMDTTIIPLLLVPFIENAFKHGQVQDAKNPVKINLTISGRTLFFYIKNKIQQKNKDIFGGIGIQNVSRRLSLLYPGRHDLKIVNDGHFFEVNMSVQF